MISLLENNSSNIHVVPNNYRNSLHWNAAHCLVTMKLLVYKLSGNEINIPEKYINLYKKGTSATTSSENIDFIELKELLISTVELLEKDYKDGKFTQYHSYETSYNVTLNSVEDAIAFNNIHEGLHFGYMLSMNNNITS